jgi:hypothetical protein
MGRNEVSVTLLEVTQVSEAGFRFYDPQTSE